MKKMITELCVPEIGDEVCFEVRDTPNTIHERLKINTLSREEYTISRIIKISNKTVYLDDKRRTCFSFDKIKWDSSINKWMELILDEEETV